MWAHMQDEPPPLRGHGRLDAVLRKALAKDREDRYGSCGELIDAAAAALGLQRPRRHAARWCRERAAPARAAILAGGVLVLAAAVGARDRCADGRRRRRRASRSATGWPRSIRRTATVDVVHRVAQTPPGNVAVGEGAVWVLEQRARDRLAHRSGDEGGDEAFSTPGVPSELAVGAGALWVGSAGRRRSHERHGQRVTARSRDRPRHADGAAPRREGVYPVAGAPRIAVGAGAVWAANPDGSVSRIDPNDRTLVATIDTDASAWTIAAGDEGVWFLGSDDPSTARRPDRPEDEPGARRRSRWAPATWSGWPWAPARCGRRQTTRASSGGSTPSARRSSGRSTSARGVSFVAFGEGAVWTANYVDGTVARIDPGTNNVTPGRRSEPRRRSPPAPARPGSASRAGRPRAP